MKVKICGITTLQDALLAESLGADYLGFIFHGESPRYIAPELAAEIIKNLTRAQAIGVFVDHRPSEIMAIAKQANLFGVQVYSYCCEQLPSTLLRIQALRIRDAHDLSAIKRYPADNYLLDRYHDQHYGGTGERFDWQLLPVNRQSIFLAGGINPNNVKEACALKPYAIDVSSGVESSPGRKDEMKLRKLFEEIASCN